MNDKNTKSCVSAIQYSKIKINKVETFHPEDNRFLLHPAFREMDTRSHLPVCGLRRIYYCLRPRPVLYQLSFYPARKIAAFAFCNYQRAYCRISYGILYKLSDRIQFVKICGISRVHVKRKNTISALYPDRSMQYFAELYLFEVLCGYLSYLSHHFQSINRHYYCMLQLSHSKAFYFQDKPKAKGPELKAES